MEIFTNDGILICCLPDNAKCSVSNASPENLEVCPFKKFDEEGAKCIPELCEYYKED